MPSLIICFLPSELEGFGLLCRLNEFKPIQCLSTGVKTATHSALSEACLYLKGDVIKYLFLF